MNSSNMDIIRTTLIQYKKAYFKEMYERAVKGAEDTLFAAFRNRQGNSKAHNYTGNLFNSIAAVVLVPPITARIAGVPERTPIFFKDVNIAIESPFYKPMSKSRALVYKYYADKNPDYDFKATDGKPVMYKPEIDPTTGARGPVLAQNWANSVKFYKSSVRKGEDCYAQIHIGYTMQYAQYVEEQHHTTGAFKTHRDAQHIFYHYIMQ